MKTLAAVLALIIGLLVALPAKAEKLDGSKIQALKVDGHRVKHLKEKWKARRAKVQPKTPDVKPAPSKPEKKPGVKTYQFSGRIRSWLSGRRDRPSRPWSPKVPPEELPKKPSVKVPSDKLPAPGKPKYIVPGEPKLLRIIPEKP